jgi:hypothetical protein
MTQQLSSQIQAKSAAAAQKAPRRNASAMSECGIGSAISRLINGSMPITFSAHPIDTTKFKKACRHGSVLALEARELHKTDGYNLLVKLRGGQDNVYVLSTPDENPRVWSSLDDITSFLRIKTKQALELKVVLKPTEVNA